MYGDTKYSWVASGSTAASAATAHALFGNYSGLSLLNANDVLLINVLPVTNSAEILPSVSLTPGMFISTSQNLHEPLFPMAVSDVRNLHFRNAVGASNSTVRWNIWRRVP
jgi:hypothetical protein